MDINQETKEYFEGLLVRANQSGKQESSGLLMDIRDHLKEITENQKIHELKDDERFSETIKKKEFETMVDEAMKKALVGTSKTTFTILKIVASIIVVLGIIAGGLKWVLAFIGFKQI